MKDLQHMTAMEIAEAERRGDLDAHEADAAWQLLAARNEEKARRQKELKALLVLLFWLGLGFVVEILLPWLMSDQ